MWYQYLSVAFYGWSREEESVEVDNELNKPGKSNLDSMKYVVDEENLWNSPEQSRVQVQLVCYKTIDVSASLRPQFRIKTRPLTLNKAMEAAQV